MRWVCLVAVVAALVAGYAYGFAQAVSQYARPRGIVCEDVLRGHRWSVRLDRPLAEQACRTNANFPRSVLCDRMVTVQCDLPRGVKMR